MATLITKNKGKLGPIEVKKNIQIHTKEAKNNTSAAAKYNMDATKHYEAGKQDKALVSVGKADAAHLLASAVHTSNIEPIGQE